MINTCGIFLIDYKNKVLLGHPTGSNETVWSIPKGIQEKGESVWEAAKRELLEETCIDLNDHDYIYNYISNYKYIGYGGRHKTLHAFIVYLPTTSVYLYNIECTSTFGKDNLPEVDNYKWVDIGIVKLFIPTPQRVILERYGI